MSSTVRIETFTKGKTLERNEDSFGFSDTSFVLADGATDKSGRLYDGKTGGEIVSRLIVREALASTVNGIELVEQLNQAVKKVYETYGISEDIREAKYRFTAGCVVVRTVEEKIVITHVGDVGMRLNGNTVYQYKTTTDGRNATLRSAYIQQTGDIAGSRDHIMSDLLQQFAYQNSADHELGFGVIDGTTTPKKFIHTVELDRHDIQTIELFTDGYFAFPTVVSIADWEKTYEQVEREDPDKYLKYKSTKSKDDRTVMILHFSQL